MGRTSRSCRRSPGPSDGLAKMQSRCSTKLQQLRAQQLAAEHKRAVCPGGTHWENVSVTSRVLAPESLSLTQNYPILPKLGLR